MKYLNNLKKSALNQHCHSSDLVNRKIVFQIVNMMSRNHFLQLGNEFATLTNLLIIIKIDEYIDLILSKEAINWQ